MSTTLLVSRSGCFLCACLMSGVSASSSTTTSTAAPTTTTSTTTTTPSGNDSNGNSNSLNDLLPGSLAAWMLLVILTAILCLCGVGLLLMRYMHRRTIRKKDLQISSAEDKAAAAREALKVRSQSESLKRRTFGWRNEKMKMPHHVSDKSSDERRPLRRESSSGMQLSYVEQLPIESATTTPMARYSAAIQHSASRGLPPPPPASSYHSRMTVSMPPSLPPTLPPSLPPLSSRRASLDLASSIPSNVPPFRPSLKGMRQVSAPMPPPPAPASEAHSSRLSTTVSMPMPPCMPRASMPLPPPSPSLEKASSIPSNVPPYRPVSGPPPLPTRMPVPPTPPPLRKALFGRKEAVV